MELNFDAIVKPIVNFCDTICGPLLAIVGVLGVIYCIYLGVRLALAPTAERRANAVSHLVTAIIAYFLIFILIYALNVYSPALQAWVSGDSEALSNVEIDFSAPIKQAGNLFHASKEAVDSDEDRQVIEDSLTDVLDSTKDFIGDEAEGISNALSGNAVSGNDSVSGN